jgi:hypothetical protein
LAGGPGVGVEDEVGNRSCLDNVLEVAGFCGGGHLPSHLEVASRSYEPLELAHRIPPPQVVGHVSGPWS